ncbi:MAG TPA: primosomal protein DnaI [Globicatella sulfidifaciens]|nr:primosomal protein DnaI [Globicatella sulfidifaciens]
MKTIQEILKNFLNEPHFNETYKKTVSHILNHPAVQEFVHLHEESVSQEMIQNSLSKLNEFVLEYDAYQAGKPGKNPGYTPILFINQNYIDIAYQPTPEFLRMQEERKMRSYIDNRMMSRDVRDAKIDDVNLDSASRKQLMSEVVSFVRQYKENPYQAQGLYIAGPFGIGKTFILGALGNELARLGIKVMMLHYPTFATEIKEAITSNQVQSIIDDVKKPQILMLDDIGAESNSAWLRDDVLSVILEYRMKEKLPTFFTSNFSMDELVYHLQETRDATENIKAARIMERVKFLSHEVRLDGENLRQKERGH